MQFLTRQFAKLFKPRPDFYSRYEKQIDQFGFDPDAFVKWELFFRFLYEDYFQVQTLGIENVPAEGRALLVGNHTGVIPMDACMLYCAIYNLHPCPRRIRFVVLNELLSAPGIGRILSTSGGVPASFDVARRLLQNDELVCIYPEGTNGTGKPFFMRYRLCDFHPGFVKEAIETNSPIIPVSTIGGDEIYPLLGNLESVARLMRIPYWPITLTYPWLPFPLSAIPLPVKLLIKIGQPIHLDYPASKARDRDLLQQLAKEIQYQIQRELNVLLSKRKSPFHSWNLEDLT
ncbi:MAG: acyltransferase family protein [Candidatus Obscuribacterales bacterium]|nr:acyltransferase family protein [Candidatus Obscuribacterales bacterium]